MSSPEDLIADLDAALEEAGEVIILRRVVGQVPNTINVDVTCPAGVRTWRLAEETLTGNVARAVLIVAISPTPIAEAQWPGGARNDQDDQEDAAVDPRMPRRFDQMIVKGQLRNINAVEPFKVAGQVVRYDMRALG